jgi:hypothetical protein
MLASLLNGRKKVVVQMRIVHAMYAPFSLTHCSLDRALTVYSDNVWINDRWKSVLNVVKVVTLVVIVRYLTDLYLTLPYLNTLPIITIITPTLHHHL